ncbi:hypothetical protein [Bradyrhizobium cytisi]|uniref:Right-handed parallel beta-helix repeat-containing protein n=1 Tax=Bradyrhizobium cytisi TaxID=515489 RepID=A0A5S4XE76_9BRAD|nr:hypothetical protein [Bradyrhizobium cytisi]TYL87790.1 hypothetical protein FXB38_03150 [Bradyrhizobium cytisi]
MRHVRAALLVLIAWTAPAVAQQYSNVPGLTVIGRLGYPGDTGPSQPIPFATLQTYLGSVFGPGSATIGNLVLWNNVTGTLLKDGGSITAFGITLVGAANAAAAYGVLGVIPCAQTAALTGDITKPSGSCVTTLAYNYTTSLTGGSARAIRSKLGDVIEAADWGVVCDGSTDTRVALQSAIDNTPEGGTLRISKQSTTGACVVSKSAGPFALSVSKPIHLLCDSSVAIKPNSTLGTTSSVNDVIHLFGHIDGINWQTIIEGCLIGDPSAASRYGRHGLVFDTTTASTYFRAPVIKNVYIQAGTSGSGYGIALLNSVVNNPNGGIYQADIGAGSIIQGGILLSGTGDSINIHDAIIPYNATASADNNGIFIDVANGGSGMAGNTTLRNLNFSQPKGVNVSCAYNLLIDGGEYEGQATLTGNALIDVSGATCTVVGTKIRNAQIQYTAGFGTPLLCRITANVGHIVFDGNTLATPTSYTPCSNASTALQVGPNSWNTGATHFSGTAAANTFGGG